MIDPVLALSLGGQIEKYGAYAGFAAIPGLAVLALLYFAQARELKRLREWAGRSPERAAELQERVVAQAAQPARAPVTQGEKRVVAQPLGSPSAAAAQAAAKPGATQPPRAPGAQPVPATATGKPGTAPVAAAKPGAPAAAPAAAATTAAPAAGTIPAPAAKPGAPSATPPARPAGAPGAAPGDASEDTVVRTPLTPPSERAPQTADGTQRAAAALGAPKATASPVTPPPAAPSPAGSAPAKPPAPAAPPPRRRPPAQPVERPRRRDSEPPEPPGPSRLPLIAGGGVGLLIAVVALFVLLGGGGDDGSSKPNTASPSAAKQPTASQPAKTGQPVDRAGTTVAVLNGTTVPGLAAQVADELEQAGFKRGQVTNAADQQRAETTVAYAQGSKPAADEVAKLIKVSKVEPLDANTQTIAGPDAAVVVTVGTDRTQ